MRYLICVLLVYSLSPLHAQWQDAKDPGPSRSATFDPTSIEWSQMSWIQNLQPSVDRRQVRKSTLVAQQLVSSAKTDVVHEIWLDFANRASRKAPQSRNEILDLVSAQVRNLDPDTDVVSIRTEQDKLGMTHHFLQQYYKGLPIFGAQLTLHQNQEGFLRANGKLYSVPGKMPERKVSGELARMAVVSDIETRSRIMDQSSLAMQVLSTGNSQREVMFFGDNKEWHRAWHVKYIPNIYENWEYVIDAVTGEVLTKWNNVCMLHDHSKSVEVGVEMPPAVGSGVDLNGVDQQVRCFEENGSFLMVDVTREMFQSLGSATQPPQGAIMTYDTKSQPVDKTGFYPNELIKSTDENIWDPKAVSAHVNAGITYEFYRQLLDRNSVNGNGGTIYSFINVVDAETGEEADQAFWNDKIMFYGNGRQLFNKPLQAALDVSAHEMSHGVVQNSANLIYQDESGAINEAMADFFGVATEARVTGVLDWRLANGVVNTAAYRSGALRDLSDPNNGGSSLNDLGYQPQFYRDRFTGSGDNGGVHINSGIVNHAFFLFTSDNSVGLDKAEKIIYRALTTYLTRSSDFQDLRNAMVASATDLHGNAAEVQAVNNAFDFVGIVEGAGMEAPMEADANPGDDFLLATSTISDQTDLYQLQNSVFNLFQSALIDTSILNPPSVTDDGTVIIYVTEANEIEFIAIDYAAGMFEKGSVSSQAIWRNAVISRDGGRIAALTTENDNMVWVFDLVSGSSKQFELSNPTFTEGVSTGNVQFADAMDFDFSGELLMYDASNIISSSTDEQLSYWDIGFVEVYDNEAGDFADGSIFKLVSGLPDNVSIGNPVFSKNSPSIIALDYIELNEQGDTEYSILGVNVETGESGLIQNITEEGGTLGYPSFSRSDGIIMFSARSADENGAIIDVVKAAFLGESKIENDPNSETIKILENHRWPVWYANGERMLTSIFSSSAPEMNFEFYPNPVSNDAYISVELSHRVNTRLRITDMLGRTILQQDWLKQAGSLNLEVSGLGEITPGIYLGEFLAGEERVGFKILKK